MHAQTRINLQVEIVRPDGKAAPDASVTLHRQSDSLLVKAAITDEKGIVSFSVDGEGVYFLKVTASGFAPLSGESFQVVTSQATSPIRQLKLQSLPKELKGVTVTGKKPFLQKLSDRIVVNVDNSIMNAGSAAIDVLERSPGIQIDVNYNILMRGRAGVTIMVDGKPSPMSGADLVNFLRSLPANAIERIDLITNPSAKYDAAGNSGIIDIRMKKDQRYGTNGSITAGYGQGVYPKTNAGLTFNHRSKKVNVFGNYSYGYRMNLNHLILDRNFFTNGAFTGKDLKDNYTKIPVAVHTARAGADFFLSSKTILGVVATSNLTTIKPANNNHSEVIGANQEPLFRFETTTANKNQNKNGVININVKHRFDSTGMELTADLDYGVFSNRANSLNSTRYYNLDGTKMQPDYVLQGLQDGTLTLATAKADYVFPFNKKRKMEAGFKTSLVNSDNDARFFDLSNGEPEVDITKTNRFYYEENNNAAYLNFHQAAGKWNVQVGLRAEQTNVKTRQQQGNIRWDSSYLQLFPSAFFTYQLAESQTLGASISRRIDRPNYAQLNPFLFLIDVTTYSTGNPGLLPQFTWNYELSYTLKQLNFTLGYSHTTQNQNIVVTRFKDVFPNIPSDDNVTVQIPVNLTSSDYIGLTVAAPVRINKWWSSINNANIFYNHFNGDLGGTNLNNGKPAAVVSTNNNFTIGKGWSAELNANFNTGGQYGFMVMRSQWGLGTGIQKSLWQGKGSLRFNITDIFWTSLPRATITFDNYIEYWKAYRESRVATLQFTYRFGNSKVQAARRRALGSDEERQRAQ